MIGLHDVRGHRADIHEHCGTERVPFLMAREHRGAPRHGRASRVPQGWRRRSTFGRLAGPTALLVILYAAGCLQRKEIITVRPDGGVDFRIEMAGEPAEFAVGGDALPDRATGWDVEDETRTDAEGKETQTRRAQLHVAAGRPLPDSYADPRSPLYEIALRFPTELHVERGPDGTYYHFRRTYYARESARYEYYREALQDNPAFKAVIGKNPEELTDEQREDLLRVVRVIEALERAEFVHTASGVAGEKWPQHYELLLRRTLLDHYADADVQPVLDLLAQHASPQRDARVNEWVEADHAAAERALRERLRELGLPRAQADVFLATYEQEVARRKVTRDCADDAWTVELRLPGELLAHNADEVRDGIAIWKFPGKALMDREVLLLATSRVDR
jgi:hypothetical protein